MIKTVTKPNPLRPVECDDPSIWETNDGRLIPLNQMDESHLYNSLRLMLGMKLDELKYSKTTKVSVYKDIVLEYRLKQLVGELHRRQSNVSMWTRWVRLFKGSL